MFPLVTLLAAAGGVGLPSDAVVIERATILGSIRPNRELVLWMLLPQKHDRGVFTKDHPYTCPEVTLGSYYSGPTRISLVDTRMHRSINMIRLRGPSGSDSFDIPYRILPDYRYLVPGHKPGQEGRPALLTLRDLNGDGLPLEAAFFQAQSCMGMPTTLIGYSPKQDKVIQYEVELKVTHQHVVKGRGTVGDASVKTEISEWCDYLFAETPSRPGYWNYEIDYRGRGGTLDTFKVHYDALREKFFGTLWHLAIPDDGRFDVP